MTSINLNRITPESSLNISSGIVSFTDTTDSTSSSDGSVILSGGLGIAKKLYVGTDLDVLGNITNATWTADTISVSYGGTGTTSLTSNAVLLGNGTSAVISSAMTYSSSTLSLLKLNSTDTTQTTSSITGAIVTAGGLGVAKNVYIGGGNVYMSNDTSNTLNFNNNGSGSPQFTTRSSGTKVVLYDGLSGSTVDHALGVDTSGLWFSVSDNSTNSFHWYCGNSDISSLSHSQMYLKQTTVSSSTSTGALRVAGGVGIAGALNVGGTTNLGTISSGTWNGDVVTVPYGGTGVSSLTSNALLLGNGTGGLVSSAMTYTASTLNVSNVNITSGTNSSSTSSGALVVSGGLGISGAVYTGSTVYIGGNLGVATTTANAQVQLANTTANRKIVLFDSNNNDHQFNGLGLQTGELRYQVAATTSDHVFYTGTSSTTSVELLRVIGTGGAQTAFVRGGSGNGDNLVLRSTSHATKGQVYLDETTASTSSTTGALRVGGGVGIAGDIYSGSTFRLLSEDTSGQIQLCPKTNGAEASVAYHQNTSFGGVSWYTGHAAGSSGSGNFGIWNSSGGLTMTLTNTTRDVQIHSTSSASSTSTGALRVSGGVGITENLHVGGNSHVGTVSTGTWNGSTITVPYGGTGATTLTANGVLVGNGTGAISVGSGISYTSSTLHLPKIISNDTTDTSGSGTGSVQISGGVYIDKKLYVTGASTINNTLDMNNHKILNLATPTSDSDAVTKGYVDASLQGLRVKDSVHVATVAPLTLATDVEDGDVIDGHTINTGDRVLIKNQASGIENGIYIVNASGSPTRSSDYANGSNASSTFMFIEQGTVNADTGWTCTNNSGSGVVGTDVLVFTQFSGAGSIIAGTGLTKTGNTLDVNASQTQITAIGTITTGTWNASTIDVAYGGTGATSLTSNAVLLGNGTSSVTASAMTYSTSTLSVLNVDITGTTASTSTITGALKVAGGVGITGALYVGGLIGSGTWNGSTIGVAYGGTGATSLTSNAVLLGNGTSAISASAMTYSASTLSVLNVDITGTTDSTSVSTGALKVAGGIGIAKSLYVGSRLFATVTSGSLHRFESGISNSDVLDLRSTIADGYSGVRFIDNTDTSRAFIGWANGSAANFTGTMYITSATNIVLGSGASSFVTVSSGLLYSEVKNAIDITDTEALLVRKDGDSGDVFTVDTTNSRVLVNNVNVTPSTGDIRETSFSASNNVSSAADVTGFQFASGTVRSFKAQVSVTIVATSNLYAIFDLYAIQKASSWVMAQNYLGDDTGITFSITTGGQVQYVSTDVSGFTSNTIKFRAFTTSV